MIKKIAVFVATQATFAFIAWMGGYDFDTRNFVVGYLTLVSIATGIGAVAVYEGKL